MGAPLPPVPNVVSLQLRGTTPGETWENVLHVQYSGPAPSAGSLQSYAGSINGYWAANVASLCPDEIVLTETVVTDIGSNSGAQGIVVTSVAGTRGDDPIPANAAMLVSYPVTLRYRGGKPRTYLLCGGTADITTPMTWNPLFTDEVQTHWRQFLHNIIPQTWAGTTFTQLVAVRRHGKYLPNLGEPPWVLTSPIVLPLTIDAAGTHSQIASQKGRIGRRSK